MHPMTVEERDRLLQRYFDGETIGNERRVAEDLLRDDPEARILLEELRSISGAVRVELGHALEEEDFSAYWSSIEQRLPKGPLTMEPDQHAGEVRAGPRHVVQVGPPLAEPPLAWLRRLLLGPVMATAGLAAVGVAMLISSPAADPTGHLAVVDHTLEIDSIESDGAMVMVVQDDSTQPAIIFFTDSQEG